MKALKYVFLVICALAEAGLLLLGVTGIFAYWGAPDPDVPTAMIIAFIICALILLSITIRSFVKLSKNREDPVLFGFLLKFPVLIFTLGIIWFALGIPEAGWLAVALSVPLAALILCLPKLKANNKKQQVKQTIKLKDKFTKEKAEWAWDDAAAEYMRLQGSTADFQGSTTDLQRGAIGLHGSTAGLRSSTTGKEFSDEENEKIYEYAGTPTAYFLGWLIRNNFVSEEFRNTYDPESILTVQEGRMTPVEFLAGYMDYVLVREDIAPDILPFVDLYYCSGTDEIPFNHRKKRYFFDYYKVVCSAYDSPRYYCVDFTWDSFQRLSDILDMRLSEFRRSYFNEDEMEDLGKSLPSQYFDTEAALYAEPGTPPAYAQKCAAAFMDMSAGLRREIGDFLIEYYVEEQPEQPTAEWVIRHFSPFKVIVFRPEAGLSESVPAYMVLGESEWEPEHGISFTVIGDHVVASGYYSDAEPPYEEDLQWRYRILEDVALGNYCAAEVIPARFGGRWDSADNQVTIPKSAAELKCRYEDLIEALYALKMAEHYDCKITYQGSRPNFLFLEAVAGQRRTFADSIALGL